jgi:Zn-dependent protease
MGLLALFQENPAIFFVVVVVLFLSLALHEWGHAISALWMGDRTAQMQGRVTLNPLKHLDILGAIMLLLVGFGWAKPVPVYPPNFRNYRVGLFVVSIAGIVINLILAVAFGLLLRYLYFQDPNGVAEAIRNGSLDAAGFMAVVAFYVATVNLALAFFNLLPIPPLDGSKILQAFLPLRWHPYIWRLEANPTYAIVALLLFFTVLRQPVQQFLGFVRTQFFQILGLS